MTNTNMIYKKFLILNYIGLMTCVLIFSEDINTATIVLKYATILSFFLPIYLLIFMIIAADIGYTSFSLSKQRGKFLMFMQVQWIIAMCLTLFIAFIMYPYYYKVRKVIHTPYKKYELEYLLFPFVYTLMLM